VRVLTSPKIKILVSSKFLERRFLLNSVCQKRDHVADKTNVQLHKYFSAMSRTVKLNREQQRVEILTLRNQGLSWSQIAASTNKSRSSVWKTWKRVQNTGSFKDASRSGRPRKLNERDRRVVVGILRNSTSKTAEAIRREAAAHHNMNVSTQTIRRSLKQAGYASYVKKKRPFLTKKHKQARLKWAKEHRTWTVDEWRNVIWSDEAPFSLMDSQGQEIVWAKSGELTDDMVTPTKKFGGGKLMVWSCITYEGVGMSTKIDDILDADLYCEIMRGELMDTINYYNFEIDEVIFQQDNDPKHTSHKAQDAVDDLGLTVMEWPAQSPDLNPIEHYWKFVKDELKKQNQLFANKEELWEALEEVLKEENRELCRELIASMPQRVQAVIKAKGGYTKY
jgi:transposase